MAQICETCSYKDGKCYCSPNSTCTEYEPEVDINKFNKDFLSKNCLNYIYFL